MVMEYIQGGDLIAAITGGVFETVSHYEYEEGAAVAASPSSLLAKYIIDTLGLMTLPSNQESWPLYISHLPDGDGVEDDCGAVYDTTGIIQDRLMTGETLQRYGIQLRVRSADYEIGWQKISSIFEAMDGISRTSIMMDEIEYMIQNMSKTSSIIPLGLEEGTKRRYHFTANFLMTICEII